jgi:hypothetical protein
MHCGEVEKSPQRTQTIDQMMIAAKKREESMAMRQKSTMRTYQPLLILTKMTRLEVKMK